MNGNTLQIGIIGCGYWGPNLMRIFCGSEDSTVKMACDLCQDRLDHVGKVYQVRTCTNLEAVIEDPSIDAVVIATPVSTHYPLARKSLMAGKHTFIEKPMTRSVPEARELVDIARRSNLILMTGHTFIYSSPVRRIKQIIESGEIGDLLYVSSQRLNLGLFQKDINVAWDLAPHDISIILYTTGQQPVSVSCQGKNHINGNNEYVTSMSLNFPDGGFATILNSWLDPNKIRRMTFVGSRKMILYDDTQPHEKIRIYDKHVNIPEYYDTFGEFSFAYHYGDMSAPYIKQEEPLKVECQHFINCIKTGQKPDSSGDEGLQVVQILEAASRSLKKNGTSVNIEDMNDQEEDGQQHALKLVHL